MEFVTEKLKVTFSSVAEEESALENKIDKNTMSCVCRSEMTGVLQDGDNMKSQWQHHDMAHSLTRPDLDIEILTGHGPAIIATNASIGRVKCRLDEILLNATNVCRKDQTMKDVVLFQCLHLSSGIYESNILLIKTRNSNCFSADNYLSLSNYSIS